MRKITLIPLICFLMILPVIFSCAAESSNESSNNAIDESDDDVSIDDDDTQPSGPGETTLRPLDVNCANAEDFFPYGSCNNRILKLYCQYEMPVIYQGHLFTLAEALYEVCLTKEPDQVWQDIDRCSAKRAQGIALCLEEKGWPPESPDVFDIRDWEIPAAIFAFPYDENIVKHRALNFWSYEFNWGSYLRGETGGALLSTTEPRMKVHFQFVKHSIWRIITFNEEKTDQVITTGGGLFSNSHPVELSMRGSIKTCYKTFFSPGYFPPDCSTEAITHTLQFIPVGQD